MAVTVIVRGGPKANDGSEAPSLTFDGGRIVLGRGRECDVRLPDPRVARRHTTVRSEKGGYAIFDEGALNGTFVGDMRLAQGAAHALKDGELVRLGPYWLELRVGPSLPTRDIGAAARLLALDLLASRLRESGVVVVPTVRAPAASRTPAAVLVLEEEARAYRVGPGADLPVPEVRGGGPSFVVERRGYAVFVRSLGGPGALFLGSEPLPAEREVLWRAGVPLRWEAGNVAYVLELDDPVATALSALDDEGDLPLAVDAVPPPPARISAPPRGSIAPSSGVSPPSATEPPAPPSRALKPAPRERTWTSVDVGVLLLAAAVLALSIVGLVWLLSK